MDVALATDLALLTAHHRAVLRVGRLATDMVGPNVERTLEPAYIIAFCAMVLCHDQSRHRNILVAD